MTVPGDPAAGAAGEMVEVIDPEGTVTAVVTRAEMRAQRLRHRTVFIAVLDPTGEQLLTHRRADWKDVWPSRWDVAFGGVLAPGESWDAAAGRELAEEAGITASLEFRGAGAYDDDDVSELSHVYLAHSDGPFTFPDGEVAEVAWVPVADLADWLATRELCPDSVALVLPLLPRS